MTLELIPFPFHVFLDSDGVFADFEGQFIKRFGKPFDSFNVNWAWEQITSDPFYFFSLDKLPGADELMEVFAPFSPTILTGCPREPGYQDAADSKTAWYAHNWPDLDLPVIACMSVDKPKHMKKPGDILVDDHVRNCESWRKAGGTAILHTGDVQATIDEFYRTIDALSQVE